MGQNICKCQSKIRAKAGHSSRIDSPVGRETKQIREHSAKRGGPPAPAASGSATSIAEPACIIKESGQNGFGGYTISYALCLEDDESESYQYYVSCNDLDEDSYDATDDDEFYDWLACRMINVLLDNPEVTDAIDLDRVNNIIAQNQYSQISRIPDLEYEDFGDIEADDVISSSEEDVNDA